MKSILYDTGNNSFTVLCTGTAPCSTMTFLGCRKLRTALMSAQGSRGNPSGKAAHMGPTVSPPAEGRHQHLVVLFRWASREGRSRAAMGLGYSRLLRKAVEQHPYCRVKRSAGLSPRDPTAPAKRTNAERKNWVK